jgi:hypothetical protein
MRMMMRINEEKEKGRKGRVEESDVEHMRIV